jgi:RND family efflux transporter MFP subunit
MGARGKALLERRAFPRKRIFMGRATMASADLSRLKIGAELRQPSPGTRRRRRGLWLGAAAAALAGAIGVLAWSGALTAAVEVRVMKVAAVFASRALTMLNASGYVVAQRKAAVSSKATGRLGDLYVEEGKAVKEGDILAQLENQDLMATLEEAKANLKVAHAALENAEAEFHDAELQYSRHKGLRSSGSVSEQSFDAVEARYRKAVASRTSGIFAVARAEASVRVADVNLEYSYIRAPFDGVVLTKNADKGEIVAPFGASVNAKAAVATMADMGSLMVEVDVAESSLEKVKAGSAAEVRLDAFPGDRFPGTVYMIVPTADRAKATVLTKVKFNVLDERILPEMSAKVAFLERPMKDDEQQSVLGIPLSSIRSAGSAAAVFRVKGDTARTVPIVIGRKWGETAEVLSGLNAGDVIVIDAQTPGLRDGAKVKVLE